jgi:hypothetical protein
MLRAWREEVLGSGGTSPTGVVRVVHLALSEGMVLGVIGHLAVTLELGKRWTMSRWELPEECGVVRESCNWLRPGRGTILMKQGRKSSYPHVSDDCGCLSGPEALVTQRDDR